LRPAPYGQGLPQEVVTYDRDDGVVSLGSTIRLAHLSDTHLVGETGILPFDRDSAATLSAVIEEYSARPDVAVITGDLAEAPSREAYRKVRALASPLADELHVVAGNHDDRVTIDEVLGAGDDLRVVPLPVAAQPLVLAFWWHPLNTPDSGHAWLRGLLQDAATTVDEVSSVS